MVVEQIPIRKYIFFRWLIKLFCTGIRRNLKIEDLHAPINSDESEKLTNKLQRNWILELERAKEGHRKPKLLKALSDTFLWKFVNLGILSFIHYGFFRCVLWCFLFLSKVKYFIIKHFSAKLKVNVEVQEVNSLDSVSIDFLKSEKTWM